MSDVFLIVYNGISPSDFGGEDALITHNLEPADMECAVTMAALPYMSFPLIVDNMSCATEMTVPAGLLVSQIEPDDMECSVTTTVPTGTLVSQIEPADMECTVGMDALAYLSFPLDINNMSCALTMDAVPYMSFPLYVDNMECAVDMTVPAGTLISTLEPDDMSCAVTMDTPTGLLVSQLAPNNMQCAVTMTTVAATEVEVVSDIITIKGDGYSAGGIKEREKQQDGQNSG